MPSRRARLRLLLYAVGACRPGFARPFRPTADCRAAGRSVRGRGVGLVVRAGGASGGDDVLALLLNKFTKLTLSKSYFMTDAIVLALSLTYIPAGRIVFSFITVTLSSFLIERIQRIGAPCAAAEQGA